MESPSDKPIFDAREEQGSSPFQAEGSEILKAELHETLGGTHHNSNLFDQDEDRAGEKIDLATGKRIDNSTDLGLGHLTVHDSLSHQEEEENDTAAQWLRKNDPNFGK